jgi:hypothetical protein
VASSLAAIQDPLARIMPGKFRFEPSPSRLTTAKCLRLCCQ